MFSEKVFVLQQMSVECQMFPFILVCLQCQVHGGQSQAEFLRPERPLQYHTSCDSHVTFTLAMVSFSSSTVQPCSALICTGGLTSLQARSTTNIFRFRPSREGRCALIGVGVQ